jgi:hypothetical protein
MVAPAGSLMRRAAGPHANRSGAEKLYRSSGKRLQRIKLRGNWSVEFWMWVLAVFFALFVLIPWLVKHPIEQHHP